MTDNISTGLAVVTVSLLALAWTIAILKKDYKNKELLARNVFISIAGISALLIFITGLARIFS